MGCDHVDRDRRLLVARVLGPIERDDDVFALRDQKGHPALENLAEANSSVAEKSIDLFDRVFRVESARNRETMSDGVHRSRCTVQHAKHTVTQRKYAFLVQIFAEYPVHEAEHIAFLELGFRSESLGSLLEAHGAPHSRQVANYATYMRQHVSGLQCHDRFTMRGSFRG